MLKISDAIAQVIYASDVAFEVLRTGHLNLSAYAQSIHDQVERKTMKSVQHQTIVVALSRLQKKIQETPTIKPNIHFDELNIQSPLFDVTYEKTKKNLELLKNFSKNIGEDAQYLTFTQGMNEMTIIAKEEYRSKILTYFEEQPKALFTDLVAVTVKFAEIYLEQPNVIYAIISHLAVKRINLIEIVSTFTELTMIIHQRDLENAVRALKNQE